MMNNVKKNVLKYNINHKKNIYYSKIFLIKYCFSISFIVSSLIFYLFLKSTINEKLIKFTQYGIPEVLAASCIFVCSFLFLYYKFEKTKKLAYQISVYSISSSIFSLFLMNIFKQYLDPKTDLYFHYVSRFSFDLMLYLCSCSVLELEISSKKLLKNLFYFHIFAILMVILPYLMSFVNFFDEILGKNYPIIITKHLLFPIKFFPYLFGITFTYKKIKKSKNLVFLPLLISFIIGLYGQTYDELMYFDLLKRNTYSVLYYSYIFLFSFILIINNYNTIIIGNIEKFKKRFDKITRLISHESCKNLSDIHNYYYTLSENNKNIENIDEIDVKFNHSIDMINYYIKSMNDTKKYFDFIKYEKINILKYLQKTIDIYEQCDVFNKKIKLNYNNDVEYEIISDKQKLQIGIDNIISNAFDHSPENSIIYINVFRNNDSFKINVENEGSINSENVKLIFKTQFSTRKSEKTNHGLGLKIAKESLGMIGCSLSLEQSSPIIFSIHIPFSIHDDVRKNRW